MPTASAHARLLARLGERARRLRLEQHLTLRELSERSGVSLRFLLQVESGRANISVSRLADMADALGTSPAALLSDTEQPRPVIALLGLRGAGKTTVGRKLAKKRRVPFVELDREIEQAAGLALREIFAIHGEEYYRRLEREALAELVQRGTPMVVAAGGGIVTSPESMQLLDRHAVTVWLKAGPEDHWSRVVQQGDNRPMENHPQAKDALRSLLAAREPLYARAAHVVSTSGHDIETVVAEVESRLHTPPS
ncbi:MAG: helix-turn-helix domain-containing protein [Acidobacteria bacterium]|nr:helix-turn-helix domain-containing protein [Acidobacteriota bacterium]